MTNQIIWQPSYERLETMVFDKICYHDCGNYRTNGLATAHLSVGKSK